MLTLMRTWMRSRQSNLSSECVKQSNATDIRRDITTSLIAEPIRTMAPGREFYDGGYGGWPYESPQLPPFPSPFRQNQRRSQVPPHQPLYTVPPDRSAEEQLDQLRAKHREWAAKLAELDRLHEELRQSVRGMQDSFDASVRSVNRLIERSERKSRALRDEMGGRGGRREH